MYGQSAVGLFKNLDAPLLGPEVLHTLPVVQTTSITQLLFKGWCNGCNGMPDLILGHLSESIWIDTLLYDLYHI